MKRNSKPKMTVLSPYKKTASLISLIYAEETPGQWPGTLIRNKKKSTRNAKADLANRHPCFLPPAAPENKADIHLCWRPPPVLPIGTSPAARHCTWATTCPAEMPTPRLPRDAPAASMASVETPRNAPKQWRWSLRTPGGVSRGSQSGAGHSGYLERVREGWKCGVTPERGWGGGTSWELSGTWKMSIRFWLLWGLGHLYTLLSPPWG